MRILAALLVAASLGALRADDALPLPPSPFPPGSEAEKLSAQGDAQMNADYSEAKSTETVAQLLAAWREEKDPVKRAAAAQALVAAAVAFSDQDDQGNSRDAAALEEAARDGKPQHVVSASAPVAVKVSEVFKLDEIVDPKDSTPTLLYRRLTPDRFEVWGPRDGWLFDGSGKLLVHAEVPRRDGDGRDWFGAFLADGTWITTDLWDDDQQLNCFTPAGKPRWMLPGADLAAQLVKEKRLPPAPGGDDDPYRPSFGWARADKTGRQWLVSLGTDQYRGYALVGPDKAVTTLPATANFWGIVYPDAMGSRGEYMKAWITSADGTRTVVRTGTYHNLGAEYPNFSLPGRGPVTIDAGDIQFGFWPDNRQVWIVGAGEPASIWLFDGNGAYEGQVTGTCLGPAANGHDLLVAAPDNTVLRLAPGKDGVIAVETRKFAGPDGTTLKPLAIFDDLGLGVFQGTGGTTILGAWGK